MANKNKTAKYKTAKSVVRDDKPTRVRVMVVDGTKGGKRRFEWRDA